MYDYGEDFDCGDEENSKYDEKVQTGLSIVNDLFLVFHLFLTYLVFSLLLKLVRMVNTHAIPPPTIPNVFLRRMSATG